MRQTLKTRAHQRKTVRSRKQPQPKGHQDFESKDNGFSGKKPYTPDFLDSLGRVNG
jgi:hypothetical protein